MQREYLEISSGKSEVIYKETLNLFGVIFRIDIKSGMAIEESDARAFVFKKSELQWIEVASIHYGSMKTKHGLSCIHSEWIKESNFIFDRDNLVNQVTRLLGH